MIGAAVLDETGVGLQLRAVPAFSRGHGEAGAKASTSFEVEAELNLDGCRNWFIGSTSANQNCRCSGVQECLSSEDD